MRVIENSPVILYVATFHVKLTPYNTMYQATGFYTCGNDNALTFLADIIIIIMLNKKKHCAGYRHIIYQHGIKTYFLLITLLSVI